MRKPSSSHNKGCVVKLFNIFDLLRLTFNWSSVSTGSHTQFSTKTTRVWFDFKSSLNLRLNLTSRSLSASYLKTKITGQQVNVHSY